MGKEFDFFDNTLVSRIARVCKVSDALRRIDLIGTFLFKCTLERHLLTPSTSLQQSGHFSTRVCLCPPQKKKKKVISRVLLKSSVDTHFLGSDAGSQKNIPLACSPLFDTFPPDPLLPSIAYHVNICVHTELGSQHGNCFGLVGDRHTELDYHLPIFNPGKGGGLK